MLFLTLFLTSFCLDFLSVSANVKSTARCSDVKKRVQCGFPGITKRKCLQDCNCCFDAKAEDDDVKCFFKVPPRKSFCDIRPSKRVACEVKDQDLPDDFDLNTEPYLCRRIGCCFDGSESNDEEVPRCYQAKPESCKQVVHRVDASSATDVTRRQCLRVPGTCFARFAEPKCYFKYAPCNCDVTAGHKVKPCSHDVELNKNPFRCLLAGCCYNLKHKCYKPVGLKKSRSGLSAQSEEEDSDPMSSDLESQSENEDENETNDDDTENPDDPGSVEPEPVASPVGEEVPADPLPPPGQNE